MCDFNTSREELLNYFSYNKYGQAYFFNNGKFIGFLTAKDFIKEGCLLKKESLHKAYIEGFKDYIADHKKIYNYYKNNPYATAAIVFDEGKAEGQFVKVTTRGQSFESMRKLQTLYKLSCYRNEIIGYCEKKGFKKIGIIVPEEKRTLVPDCFTVCELKDIGNFDLVLDSYLINEAYECFELKNVKPLDEVLFCVLIHEAKLQDCNFDRVYAFNRIGSEDFLFEDEKKQVALANNLKLALSNVDYLKKAYDQYPKDLKYLNPDLHNSIILKYNGLYNYIFESYVKGDVRNRARVVPSAKGHKNKIYVYGPCVAYSMYTTKESSLCEFLQQLFNENGIKYDVINYGVPAGQDILTDLFRFIYNDFGEDDFHVFINQFSDYVIDELRECGVKIVQMDKVFNGEHYWFFNSRYHLSPKGNKILSEFILNNLNFNIASHGKRIDILRKMSEDDKFYLKYYEVEKYKTYLKRVKAKNSVKTGFINVNANPFTSGHAYLIDYAVKRCNYLYVFVVEDNENALPFYDRFNLINEYCSKYDNVKVLSGDVFIGSKYTYSAYFNKNYNNDNLGPEEDIENFDKIIRPSLGIDIRFMGEEPFCSITRKLNDGYDKYMKTNGGELIIIPRKKYKDEIISASTVRTKFREKDWDYLSKIVPEHVMRYLKQLEDDEI